MKLPDCQVNWYCCLKKPIKKRAFILWSGFKRLTRKKIWTHTSLARGIIIYCTSPVNLHQSNHKATHSITSSSHGQSHAANCQQWLINVADSNPEQTRLKHHHHFKHTTLQCTLQTSNVVSWPAASNSFCSSWSTSSFSACNHNNITSIMSMKLNLKNSLLYTQIPCIHKQPTPFISLVPIQHYVCSAHIFKIEVVHSNLKSASILIIRMYGRSPHQFCCIQNTIRRCLVQHKIVIFQKKTRVISILVKTMVNPTWKLAFSISDNILQ